MQVLWEEAGRGCRQISWNLSCRQLGTAQQETVWETGSLEECTCS